MTALGASMLVTRGTNKSTSGTFRGLRGKTPGTEEFPTTQALSLEHVTVLRDRALSLQPPEVGCRLDTYLGIDVGSVSTNLVLIDSCGNLLKEIYVPTAGRPIEVVSAGLREIKEELGARVNIRGVGTTGSGRELIGELTGAEPTP